MVIKNINLVNGHDLKNKSSKLKCISIFISNRK